MQQYEIPRHITSDASDNITDLLVERVKKTPNLPLYGVQNEAGEWLSITALEFETQVKSLAKGLISAGIQPGQAVAIMSRTRYEWSLVDFAIWYAGAVSVPIYETSAPAQMEWILSNSDSVALFIENAEHLKRYEEIKNNTPLGRTVWRFDQKDIENLSALGKDVSDEQLEARRRSA